MFGRPPHQSSVGANCVRPPLNSLISLATFLFDTIGAKRKVRKRETPIGEFRHLRVATSVSPPAHEKLLKKFYQNFSIGCGAKIIIYCLFPFQQQKNVEKNIKNFCKFSKTSLQINSVVV